MEHSFIRYPQDIFKLNFNKIENLEGWGSQSAANLKYSIDKSKNISLNRFIFALGIRHIGQENARLIAKHLQKKDNFIKPNVKVLDLGSSPGGWRRAPSARRLLRRT